MQLKIGDKTYTVKECSGYFSRLRGLMFSRKKNILLAFPLEGRSRTAIHSFFVFFPFYAIFLNSEKEVVDFKKIKPFSIYRPKHPAKYVLEIYEEIEPELGFKLKSQGLTP